MCDEPLTLKYENDYSYKIVIRSSHYFKSRDSMSIFCQNNFEISLSIIKDFAQVL
jgi:hypothetical protein